MQNPFSPGQQTTSHFGSHDSTSASRPTTRDGSAVSAALGLLSSSLSSKDRKTSFSRKASLSGASSRRRSSVSTVGAGGGAGADTVMTDDSAPPALPDYALAAAVKIAPRGEGGAAFVRSPISPDGVPASAISRSASSTAFMMPPQTPSTATGVSPTQWRQSEVAMMHQQIVEAAQKRMSTLSYLRKAHEGRVYWFNTYLFEKSDLSRMPAYDPRKLARKATNILLLGVSIPTINDLYSSTPVEFLRCLNSLFSEFDSFQQLHGDSSSSLSRARLPNMFRRPGGKSRRSTSSAADAASLVEDYGGGIGGGGNGIGGGGGGGLPGAGTGGSGPAVMNFAAAESDLLPGEEYTYLLTPSLPFDPDFFETFATLCDVLIDSYSRFLALMPTPRECSAPVAELFAKADAKVRKLIVQNMVKDFEEHSKAHIKSEVANIGKVVLSGLM
ncbi:hypothetical protein ISF_07304 [Cordyceps fumosorosea ARSEF 2679]|uniref:Uncharacterized protein n=1 Tax=Cordyceps fumosorosea (strain ARSEF 2679) TaxID=1081104 RepID=A0A167PLM7_CORFA|nr:hypothetical protein ISF_07304 [Cordyceps fumosorosea ARSEF 2679]OAA56788.1 hypothetical protein ISF_07304 [Cordyceps fumosorosea ARSEF 2679]